MKNTFKILLATDYSESVKNAEHYALQFAKATDSDLAMLHVFEQALKDEKDPGSKEKIILDEIMLQQNKLHLHSSGLFRAFQLSVDELKLRLIEREGNASAEIIKEAERMQADLIVMGTHGETGFINRIFGNHTWEVINNTNVPVLVVPQNASFKGWKNIVFATEYRAGEIPVINFLSQMAKMFDAELTILHVSNYSLLKEIEIRLFNSFHNEVKQSISYTKISFHMLRGDEITEGLNRFCTNHQVDLLVMSPQKQELFEKIFSPDPSITKRMTYQTKISLMTIPDYANPMNNRLWKAIRKERHSVLEDM